MLKEHLLKHTMQKPFKYQICNGSRQFRSLDTLNQHSINYHNFGIIDFTGANDMMNTTNCDDDMLCNKKIGITTILFPILTFDEDSCLDRVMIDFKSVSVKRIESIVYTKEQVYTEYKPANPVIKAFDTTMPGISYTQIVKTGTALAKVKDEIDVKAKVKDDVDLKIHENEEEALKYEEESEYSEFDENVDEIPDPPTDMEFMTEEEKDDAMWEAYCESHKGTKTVELMNKAFELLRNNR
ncbi:hypothetical protein RclHR1_14050003 [Rhizophagus clarus]|uniref:C2H2-type domain-containing protein n=1 Tax=Rhizophagus clarus TaxID=94130 RepID=A0A2Z6R481_9GLOM|nr:hypothetical protein RclHR1_14050003 [Rhizophagus clarus]